MANAYDFYVGANDEHGLDPPTPGKRTPVLPHIGRSFYENEFNSGAKLAFILAALRCGFRVYDVKPERSDIPISARVARINAQRLSVLVTFAYNAYGDGRSFNNVNGYITFWSREGYRPTMSRLLAYDISAGLNKTLPTANLGVGTLNDVGVLSSVRCVSALIECGFMTNLAEAALMADPDFRSACGEGACRGVCEYLSVPYVPPETAFPTLRRGARGNYVKILQYLLSENGYPVSPDGVFGQNTEKTLTDYQRANGLKADGIAGANSWRSLRNLPPHPTLREGARGNAVKYLQQKLLAKLFYAGAIDGIFGPIASEAVRAFQRENDLVPDGIVGPKTWASLAPIGGIKST